MNYEILKNHGFKKKKTYGYYTNWESYVYSTKKFSIHIYDDNPKIGIRINGGKEVHVFHAATSNDVLKVKELLDDVL